MPERWWICKGGFIWTATSAFNRGSKYSGPYSTREDAFTARRTIEMLVPVSFFVDQEPGDSHG